jgi:hypothetical protein
MKKTMCGCEFPEILEVVAATEHKPETPFILENTKKTKKNP